MRYIKAFLFLIVVGIITGIVFYFMQKNDMSSSVPSELNNIGNSIKEKFIVPDWLVK